MVHMKEGGGIDGGIGKLPQGPGHVTFYVGVDDAQSALREVERHGGKTIPPPVQVPGGVTFALFADPEGHRSDSSKRVTRAGDSRDSPVNLHARHRG